MAGGVRMSNLLQFNETDTLKPADFFLVSTLNNSKYTSKIISYSTLMNDNNLWAKIKEKIQSDNFVINGNWTFNQTINGRTSKSYWGGTNADLAEKYLADADYEPGTLVKFGGDAEITIADNSVVNAVITTDPAFVMNQGLSGAHPAMIALVGRVPVKVKGGIQKFDKVYLSDEPGIGIAKVDPLPADRHIAIAMESNADAGIKLVECVIKFDF